MVDKNAFYQEALVVAAKIREEGQKANDPLQTAVWHWAGKLVRAAASGPWTASIGDSESAQLDDLPTELKAQLRNSKGTKSRADSLHAAIVELLREQEQVLRVDDVLVGIYRNTAQILERNATIRHLRYMAIRGYIKSVPGFRGGYVAPEADVSIADQEQDGLRQVVVTFASGHTVTAVTRNKGKRRGRRPVT